MDNLKDHDGLQKCLLKLAELLEEVAPGGGVICRAAVEEIALLRRIIINDPVELPIEEGDRANG